MITELPNNPQAERAFLGLLFARPQFVQRFSGTIFPRDFYKRDHQLIFESMQRIAASDELPLDMVGVSKDLMMHKQLDMAGGSINVSGIAGMSMNLPVSLMDIATCKKYAEIIIDCSRRRDAIKVFEEAVAKAERGDDVAGVLQCVNDTLENVNRGTTVEGIKNTLSEWEAWYEETKLLGECPGITTGLFELDSMTGGWNNGNLIILGARPNMGKTALALNFASAACRAGRKVAFFSLEMTKRELISRIIATEGGIEARHANIPALMTDAERRIVDDVFKTVNSWGLYIDDSSGLPMSQIAIKSRRLKYAGNLDLVIIDHLNFIGTDTKKENRTNEVSDITKRLKGLAKELDVPVICLCQLSRAVESRPDKKPQLSDLRESGTIEQDADLVLMLYRNGYYTKDQSDRTAELIIAKQRGGRTGSMNLIFDGDHQQFIEDALQGVITTMQEEDLPL